MDQNDVWQTLIHNLHDKSCCSVKDLDGTGENPIYVARICDINVVKELYQQQKENRTDLTDSIHLSPTKDFLISFIPKSSKYYVALDCCDIPMIRAYQKIRDYGIIIEGCFSFKPITVLLDWYGIYL